MSTMGPEVPEENFVSEDELKSLLDRWIAPQASKTLDQRIANSYHMEMGSADPASTAAPFPLSQHEVVKMKVCSTCKEEFADKFGFCPVDGTPLNGLVSEPTRTTDNAWGDNVPVVSDVPIEPPAAGEPILAGAGSMALVPRGEFHLTMIDDAGLVGRLAKEVSDVAHEYQ